MYKEVPITLIYAGLSLESGNLLPFSEMQLFQVHEGSSAGNVSVTITTTYGSTFNGVVTGGNTWYSDYICGLNRLGEFKLELSNEVKSISFDWNS